MLSGFRTFPMQVFEGLWGTNELLSSFDSINILKPGQHESSTDGWLHVDQAPIRKGVACIQGLVNMVDVSPETGQSELRMLLVHLQCMTIIATQCMTITIALWYSFKCLARYMAGCKCMLGH